MVKSGQSHSDHVDDDDDDDDEMVGVIAAVIKCGASGVLYYSCWCSYKAVAAGCSSSSMALQSAWSSLGDQTQGSVIDSAAVCPGVNASGS